MAAPNPDALEAIALKAGLRKVDAIIRDAVDLRLREFDELPDGTIVHKPTGLEAPAWYAKQKADGKNWWPDESNKELGVVVSLATAKEAPSSGSGSKTPEDQ